MLIDQIPDPQAIRQREENGDPAMAVGLKTIVGPLGPLPSNQNVVRPPQIGQRIRLYLPVDAAGLDDVPIRVPMDLLGFQVSHLGPTIHNTLGLSRANTSINAII